MVEYHCRGHRVICTQSDLGLRMWHCDCSEFERRLVECGEGFCEHVVRTIERTILEEEEEIMLSTDR